MDVEFRKLLPNESNIYRQMRLESLREFPEAFYANYEEALHTEKLKLEINIEQQTPDKFVMGAFVDAELIGMGVFILEENNSGGIYQMYVKEHFHRKNVGGGLITAIMNEAANNLNVKEIHLEITTKNKKAYNFYSKLGFKKISNNEINMHQDSNIVMTYDL